MNEVVQEALAVHKARETGSAAAVWLLLLALLPVFGQGARGQSAGAVPDTPARPSITGQVLSDPSGDPVVGAVAAWESAPEISVSTGRDGVFVLPLPPAAVDAEGPPALHVVAPGHAPATLRVPPPTGDRAEPDSAGASPTASGAASGAARGESGAPSTAATGAAPPPSSAQTDGSPGGSPGDLPPAAFPPGDPPTADRDPSAPPRLDVTVVLLRQGDLRGQVLGPDDRPLPGARVRYRRVPPPGAAGTFERQQPSAWDEVEAGAEGLFRTPPLSFGRTYQLRATAEGAAPGEWLASAGGESLLLRLGPGSGVEGRVVDSTGAPVAGAAVGLRLEVEAPYQPDRSVEVVAGTSGEEGDFRLSGVAADRYAVTVEAAGSPPLRLRGLELPEGRLLDLGTVVLEPEATIEGRLVDVEGHPWPGVAVSVLDRGGGAAATGTVSDDEGRFRIGGLDADEVVHLRVGPPPPGAPQLVSNLVVPATGLEVVITTGASLVGRVTDPAGRGVEGAVVAVRGSVGERRHASVATVTRQTRSGADGAFRLDGLPEGPVEVVAEPPPALAAHRPARLDSLRLLTGEVHGPIDLALGVGAAVRGTVRHRDGTPASRVRVVARPVALDGSPLSRTVASAAVTDAAGTFRIAQLPPGLLHLDAVTHRGRAHWRGEVGEAGAEVELVVEPRRYVAGRVVNEEGHPVARARVRLRDLSGRVARRDYTSEATGVDGRFLLLDVPPGRFRVEASADGYAVPSAASAAPEVELGEGPTGVDGLVLVLSRGAALGGEVTGLDESERTSVRIRAVGVRDAGTEVRDARVRADGGYRLEGLGPGRWQVRAWLPATGRSVQGGVEIRPGDEERRLDLHLAGGLVLSGEVRLNDEVMTSGDVSVFPAEGEAVSVPLRHDGTFRAEGIAAGPVSLHLTVYPPGSGPQGVALTHDLDLAADRNLLLDFDTGVVLVRVTDAAGLPVAGAWLTLGPVAGPGVAAGPNDLRFGRTGADGTFRFHSVEEGLNRLEVYDAAGGELRAAQEVSLFAGGEVEAVVRVP